MLLGAAAALAVLLWLVPLLVWSGRHYIVTTAAHRHPTRALRPHAARAPAQPGLRPHRAEERRAERSSAAATCSSTPGSTAPSCSGTCPVPISSRRRCTTSWRRTRASWPTGAVTTGPPPTPGAPAGRPVRRGAISHRTPSPPRFFPMRISVIGCGYLGAVHAACMAELGHDVVGVDVDEREDRRAVGGPRAVLRAGPARGPRARRRQRPAPLHDRHGRGRRGAGALRRGRHAADRGQRRRRPDLRRRRDRRGCCRTCRTGDLVVGKSTVPVGTAARLAEAGRAPPRRGPTWPGTRSSSARASPSHDTVSPDRLVYGVPGRRRRRAGHRAARRGLRDGPRDRDAPHRHRLRDRRARQGVRQRVPRHEDLVHQRHGRDRRGHRRRRHPARRRDRPRRPHRPPLPQRRHRLRRRLPAEGHPRVHGPRRRARPGESLAFLAEVDAINLRRRERVVDAGRRARRRCRGLRRSPCSASPSSPTPTTCATRPPSTSPGGCTASAPTSRDSTPRRTSRPRGSLPSSTTRPTPRPPCAAPTWSSCSPSGSEFRALDPETVGSLVAQKRIVDGRNVLDLTAWRAAGFDARGLGRP